MDEEETGSARTIMTNFIMRDAFLNSLPFCQLASKQFAEKAVMVTQSFTLTRSSPVFHILFIKQA
jgi:hypothetical protein